MFLNFLKDFAAKKIVNRNLAGEKSQPLDGKVETVGILIDESVFLKKDALIDALVAAGIREDYIRILAYRERIRKSDVFNYPIFSHADLNWSGLVEKSEIQAFDKVKFDLLINYFDTEKTPLMLVAQQSAAAFKVGFASVDKRLNHFMIDTTVDEHQVFTDELIRYLKILNKL